MFIFKNWKSLSGSISGSVYISLCCWCRTEIGSVWPRLAGDLGPEVVGAHAHVAGVDQAGVGRGHGVRGSHGVGVGVTSSQQDLRIGLGLPLAVDVRVVRQVGVGR